MTAEHRAEALRQLQDVVSSRQPTTGHADLQTSRVKRDESDVTSIMDMLENNWTNPFLNQPMDLLNLSTAERAEHGSKLGIVFSQIKPGHRIKNWKRILASIETKAKLTKFMAENWKELRQREKLGDVILMVTSGERCLG